MTCSPAAAHAHPCIPPTRVFGVQLSGGERSYTTVAFTLALGGQTEMPFRAMVRAGHVGVRTRA